MKVRRVIVLVLMLALLWPAAGAQANGTTVLVDNLQPSWTAPGGGGVFSAYVGPPAYGYVSPGSTATYDGREAGIIKAGLAVDPVSGHYKDEGLFAFKPDVTINTFAAGVVSYDVETEAGVNPVWMTIEIDTGVAGDRNDNTTYQHVPTSNPAGWHTVNAAAGQWQKWNDNNGDVTGNPLISLNDVVTAHTGLDVVRAYLRLGMGDSYNNGGTGTIAWVDKATLAGVTYDFVLARYWYVDPTGSDSNEGTLVSPFLTIQHAIDSAAPGDTIHVAAGTYAESLTIAKQLTILGAGSTVAGSVLNATGNAFNVNAGGASGTPLLIQGFRVGSATANGVQLGNGVEYVRFEDVVFSGVTSNGVRAGSAVNVAYLEFVNVHFVGGTIDVYLSNETLANASKAEHVLFDGCSFTGSMKGIYAEKLSHSVIHNCTFNGTGSDSGYDWAAAIDINLKWADYSDIEISDCVFTNCAVGAKQGAAICIKARGTGDDTSYAARPATLDDVEIKGCTITGSERGIRIGEPGKTGMTGPTGVVLWHNKISGNNITYTGPTSPGGDLVNLTTVNTGAENNYWGTVIFSEIAPKISGPVDWSPWCNADFSDCDYHWPVHNVTRSTDHQTIQSAIDAATAGDEIHIDAGTYAENVVVNKTVTLAGAGAGSTTVMPAVSNPICTPGSLCGGAASNVFLVQANGVLIRDLTVDGDNPALTSGIVRGGADLDARNGIIKNTDATYDGLEVRYVEVKNIYLRGIYSTGGSFNFHHNVVTNVQGDGSSIAMFAWGGPGIMAYNDVSYANDALSANHSKGIQFLNNTVTHSQSGVHTDNSGDGGGVADLIQGNSVTCDGSGYGVWSFVPYLAPTFNANTVTNCDVGLSAWGQGAAVTALFTNNTVVGPSKAANSVGAYLTTDTIGWGYADVSVSLSNNLITGFDTAVYLTADKQSWNPGTYEAKTIDSAFYGNSFADNTNGIAIGTSGTYKANASGNWWGSADPATVKAAANGGAIVDYTPWLASGTDTTPGTPGFQGDFSTLWVDDDSPQTGSKGRIQEGIDLVSGSTVHVAAGTYTGRVVANKAVTLLGPNAGVDPCSGSRVAEAEIHTDDLTNHQAVLISSSDVTVDGFTVYGPNGAIKNIGALGLDGSGPRTNVHIQYNRIFRTAGGTDWNGDGIRLDPPSNEAASIFVEHNRIESGSGNKGNNNISLADHGYRTAHGSTWTVGDPDRVTIAHNCLYGHGKMYIEGIGVLIDDNVFSGNWGPIEVRGAKDVVISNNEMLNQVDIGIFAWSPKTASGKGVCTDLEITGNTIQGMQLDPQNFTDEGTAIVLGGVTNATVSGNNLTGNANYGVVIGGIDYDHFYPEDIGWGGGLDVGYSPVNNVLDHNNISGNVVAGVINKTTVMVNAENNWWGDASGPLDTNGTNECPPCNSNAALDKNLDGAGNAVSEYVDYCPWLGAPPPEAGTLLYLDPVLGSVPNDHTTTKTYTVRIANAANMYGYQFVVTFDKDNLECTAAAFDGTFFPTAGGKSSAPPLWDATIDNLNGTVKFARTLLDPEPALTGSGPLATVTFRGDTGASDGQYKLDFQETKLANKDGDALPVTAQFGWLELYGTGNLAGSVDLQGRSNESGAVVTIISVGGHTAWTTTVVNGSWSFTGIPAVSYQVNIEQERYLDAQKGAAGSGVVVTAGGTTTLNKVKLLGGDANDDDLVDISDGAIIGGMFGRTGPSDPRSDINNDGTVDIMDLVLFGGNYNWTSPVPWS